tara:strand:+ start:10045 stop:10686 length:642 start_codon:yes stop_codon:yes gene_type:complete
MINIYNQDCMEAMKEMSDNQFDLAIVDPPYGLERYKRKDGGNSKVFTFGDVDKNWNNEKPKQEYFDELFRVSKNQIIWGANNFELPPSEYFLCWNKEQPLPNFATLEYAWVSMGLKKPAKLFTYNIFKVQKEHKQSGGKIHPTQKPVKLYEWLLMNYAKEGDKILDTHLGSGSIAIACHNLGYDLTGYEIDKEYFEAAQKRINIHKQQKRLFI